MARPRSGATARLTSIAIIPGETPWCLEFYYYMYGAHVGELNVYLTDEDGMSHVAWSRAGDTSPAPPVQPSVRAIDGRGPRSGTAPQARPRRRSPHRPQRRRRSDQLQS